jgi:hypothetical protein
MTSRWRDGDARTAILAVEEPVEVPGRWTPEGRDRVAIRFGGARQDYAFTVVSVDTARLQIRPESLPAQYASGAEA